MTDQTSPIMTDQISKGSGEGGGLSVEGDMLVSREPKKKTPTTELINTIEAHRAKTLSQHNMRVLASFVLALICGMSLLTFTGLQGFELMQVLLGLFIVLGIYAYMPILTYRKAFKTRFMPEFVKNLGDFNYYPERPLNRKVLDKSGLILDRFNTHMEDYIGGTDEGRRLEFAEIIISNPARPKPKDLKDRRFKGAPVGKGMAVVLTFDKAFAGHTILTAKRGTMMEKSVQLNKPFMAVDMPENAQLQWLDVYSTKPEKALLAANTTFIKQLQAISLNLFNAPLELALFDTYAVMMLPYNKNLFEPTAINKPAFSIEDIPTLESHVSLLKHMAALLDEYLHEQHSA